MSKPKHTKLGTHLDVITDYHANGSYEKLKENVKLLEEDNYAVIIRTLNFERNDFRDDLLYVTKEAYDFLEKSYVIPNDILMNKISNPGRTFIMPDMHRPVTCGMNLFLIRFKDTVNQRYMYYNMKNVEKYIRSLGHGTTTKTITKDEVRAIDLWIHNKEEQDKIEAFLTGIDNKIANNYEIGFELVDTIRDLYNYWFVQYDFPYKDGKGYKASGGKFVKDKEAKMTYPEGWELIALKKRFNFNKGVETGKKSYQEEPSGTNVLYYRVSDLAQRKDCETYVERSLLQDKFLTEPDVCVSFDGTVGKVDYGLNGGYSSGIKKVSDKKGVLNNAVIFAFFVSEYAQRIIKQYATGSNILHATKSIDYMYLPYNKDVFLKFRDKITPMFDKMLALKRENAELTELKQLLLPMLMNGQVILS